MVKKPWKKILYEEQEYPDNYVDESFLDELRKNGSYWRMQSWFCYYIYTCSDTA